MPLSELLRQSFLGGVAGRVRTRKDRRIQIQKIQEERNDPMRDDVDGEEAMVPRVPNLPPVPSARQIAEHELTGTRSVQKLVSPLRSVEELSACALLTRGRELPEIGIDYGLS